MMASLVIAPSPACESSTRIASKPPKSPSSGLERQKYSRRKKTAKGNNDNEATSRLEAEYKVLKYLESPELYYLSLALFV
jgi:hypothetical protein